MGAKELFCFNCASQQEVESKQESWVFDVLDTKVKATITVTYCKKCGGEVWDEEAERENDKIMFAHLKRRK